jgi:transglutaminase-like putative cysteine protease
MRLLVDHRTRYSFSEPQMRVVQLLRMTPRDHARQTVIDWRIDVDCDARLREGRDGYGNITTMLYVDGPVTAIELIVRGEVQTEESGGVLEGVSETLPPLFYLRPTLLTAADPSIEALANRVRSGGEDRSALAAALTSAVNDRIRIVSDRTPKTRTAAATLEDGWGNGRDAAHLLIALARVTGIAARFVSGHSLGGPNVSDYKSAHCWAELFCGDPGDERGWISFDPSTGGNPGANTIRVASGLDAGDATPLSGTRRGGGIEELAVDVRVALRQDQAQ